MKFIRFIDVYCIYCLFIPRKKYKSVEKIEKNLEQNMTNKVNIEFLQKQVEKMSQDIEKLKDANREIVYKNGGTH